MARLIPEQKIEEIRNRVDIVEIIGRYVRLEKSGNKYKGLCPFHQEKTPSFTVDSSNQLFYCFGCQTGGNVFNFLMKKEGWSFPEAARFLAQEYGISLPEENGAEDTHKEKLFKLNSLISRFFQHNLRQNKGRNAQNYIKKRGLNREIVELSQLGYAPDSWDDLIRLASKKNMPLEYLRELGLVIARRDGSGYYDRFRNRIIFPISDILGRTIGFGGRAIGDVKPKYLNSPETTLYNKGKNLYGLFQARQALRETKTAIIMEGYLDVLAAWQFGIRNAIASLGTALTSEQARLLRRFVGQCIICYDADTAGAKATLRGLDILAEAGLGVKVAQLPDGMDPDDVLRHEGADTFNDIISKAVALTEYKVEKVANKYDRKDISQQISFVEELIPILDNVENQVSQAGYIDMFAEKYNLHRQALHFELQKFRKSKKDKTVDKRDTRGDIGLVENNKPQEWERQLLHILSRNPSLLELVNESCFEKPSHRRVFQMMKTKGKYTISELQSKELLDEDLQLLARFATAQPLEGDCVRIVTDLKQQIRLFRIDREIDNLRNQIRQLEKVGEFPVEMLQKVTQLQKERARLGST